MKIEESKTKKKPSLLTLILCQLLLTGLVLCVFAAFHHVIPRWLQSRNGMPQPIATVEQPTEPSQPPEPSSMNETEDQPVEPEQTEEPEVEDEVPLSWRERFAEHFSETETWTENSYSSPNLSVTVTEYKHTEDHPEVIYYVADIYIAEIESFLVGFPENSTFDAAETIAASYDAVVAVNGDGMLVQGGGFLIRNGEIYDERDNGGDLCVLYSDGSMETYASGTYTEEEILARQPLHCWQFGPALLDREGQPLNEFNISWELQDLQPRTALGYYEPGHYCLLVADGRNPPKTKGLEMWELAELMSDLGCQQAYNLDGGASSMIIFHGKTINDPPKTGLKHRNRNLNDMLIFAEPRGEEEG